MFNMLTKHIQAPRTVDTCDEETCIFCAINLISYLLLFNDCSSLVYLYTMIVTCIYRLEFMEVMASAKRYVVSYAVSACLVFKHWFSG